MLVFMWKLEKSGILYSYKIDANMFLTNVLETHWLKMPK